MRPRLVKGYTEEIETGCGTIYLTRNEGDGYFEYFIRLGKCGGCALSMLDGVARLMTFARNAGVEEATIIRAFLGSRCPTPKIANGVEVLSCLDSIAKLLQKEESNGH